MLADLTLMLAVFNARTDQGSGIREATANPYLWGALVITVGMEAMAVGIAPLRDLLELTVLSPTGVGRCPVPGYRASRVDSNRSCVARPRNGAARGT